MSLKRLLKSFKYAFSGILHTIQTEQNMRIHLSAASFVIAFAYFFGISKPEWALLFVVIGFVFFAELLNTAIERLADACIKEYDINIKYAKDAAAGGVVAAVFAAVAAGIVIFGDIGRILSTVFYILNNFVPLAVFICLAVINILFLLKAGKTD